MKKGEIKRKNLLEEAEKLFFLKGYFPTGINELVEVFHCTKGSFYHHFSSKLQILSEVCALRSEKAFAEYKKQSYLRNADRLNGLLYYALPFRTGEKQMLSMILPLAGSAEADAVIQAVLRAQRAVFLPEMERLLESMREKGECYFFQPALPSLLFDAYAALYQKLLSCCAVYVNTGARGPEIEAINAARFLFERLLDLPYGSMVIIDPDEAVSAAWNAAHIAAENGEPEVPKENAVLEEARRAADFAQRNAEEADHE